MRLTIGLAVAEKIASPSTANAITLSSLLLSLAPPEPDSLLEIVDLLVALFSRFVS